METDRDGDDGEIRYDSVFRERWRDRQSAATRPVELIKQQGWINAGLVALGVLLAAGAVAGGTVGITQTETLAAVAHGTSVTAARDSGAPPAQGAAASPDGRP